MEVDGILPKRYMGATVTDLNVELIRKSEAFLSYSEHLAMLVGPMQYLENVCLKFLLKIAVHFLLYEGTWAIASLQSHSCISAV